MMPRLKSVNAITAERSFCFQPHIAHLTHSPESSSPIQIPASLSPSTHQTSSSCSNSSREMRTLQYTSLALLLLLFLASSFLQNSMAASAFCEGKCKARCAKASRQDGCLRYCGLCCEECNCVPSGTYGNKDECPCYRDMLTAGRRKRPKCP